MSNDTISKIKLRLNNNLKIKQSKSQVVSALSNRMYANSQTSNCNDYFANCCNCCNGGCICCNCLAGFIITIEGWQDGTCDCSGLNITDVFVPKISCGEYNRLCELHGGSAPQGTYPNYTCPDPEGSNVTSFFCIEGPFAGNHPAGISWELYCIDGQLYLKVYHASNKSLKSGFIGGGETYMDGFGIWSSLFTPVDCDDLEISGSLSGGSCSDQCNCGGVTFTANPVFGGPLAPPECQCCRPERCESSEPDCLNPYPDTLTVNLIDNCTGAIATTLVKEDGPFLCWHGGYTTSCEECDDAIPPIEYAVSIDLCCIEGVWVFGALVTAPLNACGGEDTLSWSTNPTVTANAVLMTISDCDPMSFTSNAADCVLCEWRSCEPEDTGDYCLLYFTITE